MMGLIVASVFSGCAETTDQLKIPQVPKNKTVVFAFEETDAVSGEKLVFNFNDYLSDKHNEKDIVYGTINWNVIQFSSELAKLSKYKRFHRVNKDGTDYKGIRVSASDHEFDFSYENGEHNRGWFLNKAIFKINYTQEHNNSVVFTFPQYYVHHSKRNIIGVEMEPIDTLQNIEKDAKSVFENLDKVVLLIYRTYTLKGEVNSKYSDRSIYGNFERILGKYSWKGSDKHYTNEIKKENTYAFTYGKKTYPLHIEVYPYREGTKIVYSLYLEYEMRSDGTSSLTKEDVASMKAKIASIAND